MDLASENAVHLQGVLDEKVIRYITTMAHGDDAPALGKGRTMTKYGNLLKGVVAAFMMMGIVACSMIASPPVGQISQNDHAALATWYDKEAAQLRQKAKDMADMEVAYAKNPAYGQSIMAGIGKENFNQHCDALKAMYTKGAEEADQLAKKHRSMVK